ncbi:MAG: HAMP domain-containing histidine kinase [Thaumarchaeota archaeon]|nr:HAMP domain-containing histidine kinase [Nitrososphaerota archaeon]
MSEDEMHNIRELEQEKILLSGVQDILNQKELKMSELCAIVSHEFKTPLVPIKAYLEMLLEGNFGKLTKKQEEKIVIMQANAERLFGLIEEITEFKKIEIEGLKIQKKRVVLSQIITNTIKSLQNATKENKINIIHDPSPITIICDPDRISTVIKNLIKNSLDISTQSNRLGIYVKDNEDEVEIMVKDNGVGIRKEEQKFLFEKFKQIDMSSTREKGGLGLGLYLSKKIIQLHGGKIWLESQPEKGTAVHFSLPKNQ